MWPWEKAQLTLGSRCETRDIEAGSAHTSRIGDRSEIADPYLGDAPFRFRRARSCFRHGFVSLTCLDYDALLSNRYSFER
jgi:hypothetical protein